MRKFLPFVAAAVLCSAGSAQMVAIRAGKLVDTDAGTVKTNVVVLINSEDGRIKAVGPNDAVAIPKDASPNVLSLSNPLETETQRQLNDPGIIGRGDLPEGAAIDVVST